MFKKLVISTCCVAMVASMSVTTALAADHSSDKSSSSSASTRAEESKWLYKVIDRELHKRQWSITYGIWLTDWILIPSGT